MSVFPDNEVMDRIKFTETKEKRIKYVFGSLAVFKLII